MSHLVTGEWFLQWDNTPLHTVQLVQSFLAKNTIQVIPLPPCSPDLVPADFFLVPDAIEGSLRLDHDPQEVQTMW